MPESKEVRLLGVKWAANAGWPKRLDWVEIKGLRGWQGQRFELRYPIMAVVGENGAGKSTILQCCASVYGAPAESAKERFASDFFPDTAWDKVREAEIRYSGREGDNTFASSVRKPTGRWRGNPDRKKRPVEYIDLSRIQPVAARVGFSRLANGSFSEASAESFDLSRLTRFSRILGRTYDVAKMALTDADDHRSVPVITQQGDTYSGFHQGAGETTIVELLQADIPKYSLVIIDEVESSLHPRAQRRLIRDLADRCRESELQVVLSTHSPYVLAELPPEARAYIMQSSAGRREIIYGVSPDFAMTQMDDVAHSECDLYVEDPRAERMLVEILSAHQQDIVQRCQYVPYGAASVGNALGQMVEGERFPRPSVVFLDGDCPAAPGCALLPGGDAPERVVFEALQERGWNGLADRIGREHARVADACQRAMTLGDHHGWVNQAASQLVIGGDTLWQAMCAEWAKNALSDDEAKPVVEAVEYVLAGIGPDAPPDSVPGPNPEDTPSSRAAVECPTPRRDDSPIESMQLFDPSSPPPLE
jgi:predicted ATPase